MFAIQDSPLFADIAKLKAASIILEEYDWHQRMKLFKDANKLIWDDSYLFKIGASRLLRRALSGQKNIFFRFESLRVLMSDCGIHFCNG